MSASPDVVRMKDVQSEDRAFCVRRDPAVRLGREKGFSGLRVPKLLLRKRQSVLHDLIPYADHGRKIPRRVRSDFDRFRIHGSPPESKIRRSGSARRSVRRAADNNNPRYESQVSCAQFKICAKLHISVRILKSRRNHFRIVFLPFLSVYKC